MTLGKNIAHYRKQLGLTQDALAQKLGITNQSVSKWESGQSCPDVQLLPVLADLFSISLDALFGRTAPESGGTQLPWGNDNTLRVAVYVGQKLVCGGLPAGEYGYPDSVDNVLSCVSVSCGDVYCSVHASGDVTCGNVMGHANAGRDLTCGEVMGNVTAGLNTTCGDVSGSVDAGCTVECGSVGGNVNACGPVTFREVTTRQL